MALNVPLTGSDIPNPETFLTTPPPPSVHGARINFTDHAIPEYEPYFAFLIDDLLTPLECRQLLHLAQESTSPPNTWSVAEVNVGNGMQRLILDARNCGRIIWDDATIADRLLTRIKPHLPANIMELTGKDGAMVTGRQRRARKAQIEDAQVDEEPESWTLTRLNERLRFLKYTSGMFFKEHTDGVYRTPNGSESSYLTVHVYLNGDGVDRLAPSEDELLQKAARLAWYEEKRDQLRSKMGLRPKTTDAQPQHADNDDDGARRGRAEETSGDPHDEPLVGGATRFWAMYDSETFMDVNPKAGACLVFQHRNLLHSGEEVVRGVKYTVRTDVMYSKKPGTGGV